MGRAFYYEQVSAFLTRTAEWILGTLAAHHPHELTDLQKNSWLEQIAILKASLSDHSTGLLMFEYAIPRMGKRIDVVLIDQGLIFLIEFKIGAAQYEKHAIDQIVDYALDLQNFHQGSHDRLLIPILVASRAPERTTDFEYLKTGILSPILCNASSLNGALQQLSRTFIRPSFDPLEWLNAPYSLTPTIIEAAQVLYAGHQVDAISRNDAHAYNLSRTSDAIHDIIESCKSDHKKAICFITGVPGAGKTLAGLNIANLRHRFDEQDHAVFLSGNQPLVEVLQEALARDEHERMKIPKKQAKAKTKAFIQNIYHFRDDTLAHEAAPIEKITLFDEAQRAWTKEKLSDFMARKKGRQNFSMSEPAFLLSVMDRHPDWAVIVCLVGGGQEIHDGEAGLSEWFDALRQSFNHWQVYLSDHLSDSEFLQDQSLEHLITDLDCYFREELHLAVSLRSFRSEKVSAFVKALLDEKPDVARDLLQQIGDRFPIVLTRDLDRAKRWIREQAKGTERIGLIASSGAHRLRPQGIWVKNKISSAPNWFLNDTSDVRSSNHLEEVATEFDIQGLELDWTLVAWDADLRFQGSSFGYYHFSGSKWQTVQKPDRKLYLKEPLINSMN